MRLAELPAGETPEGKPIVRRGLVANEDLEEGQVIYTESPLVSGLYPSFEVCILQCDKDEGIFIKLTYDGYRDPTAITVSRRSLMKTRLLARTVTRLCTAARNARIQLLNHITDICAPRMKRH